ncbi:MAG: uroporphyrinogen decarboxylase family protein [Promethearchaeota archaeon]
MKEEYMTPQERMTAAINLEKPDRVPINPLAGMDLAATYYGLSTSEMHKNPIYGLDTMLKFFDEFGGWDGYSTIPLVKSTYILQGFKVKVPGQELPDNYYAQFDEGEWMKVEDYKTIADIGWSRFVSKEYIYRISDWTPEDVDKARKEVLGLLIKAGREWVVKRKIGLRSATAHFHPFFALSLNRSMIKFTQDLYYRPELVEAALDTMTDELIREVKAACKLARGNVVFIPEERAEAAFYPLKIFERFWWPYTKRIVEGLSDKGIIPWFHLDQCWDLNIPYFKELPRASCILDLDGLTDIFRAKEILKDHLCLMSDVSASLFSIGTPKQVEDYVKKLINKLGIDGGHILGSGCEVPPDCKPENFKAYLHTGKTYQLSEG